MEKKLFNFLTNLQTLKMRNTMLGSIILLTMVTNELRYIVVASRHCKAGSTCYSGQLAFQPGQIKYGKYITGYSYKTITTDDVKKCYSACIGDCRCNACQMKDGKCELLDYDRKFRKKYFKSKSGYKYIDLNQQAYQEKSNMLPPGDCQNGCCRSQPCLNGGTCIEHCDSPEEKFTCACTNKYTGRICERYISDCYDVLKYKRLKETFRHKTFIATDEQQGTETSIICAMGTSTVWTLVESFKFSNNMHFQSKAFFQDSPRSPALANWDDYRMTLTKMQAVRATSRKFRVTCSYERRDKVFPDYLTASFRQVDLMAPVTRDKFCFRADIDVRGNYYKNKSIPIWQKSDNMHAHIDVSGTLCEVSPTQFSGSLSSEDSFGYYAVYNTQSKCVESHSATTNWWFGRNLEA